MRTSGQVFDLYDDSKGEVLREVYPSQADIPVTVKTARMLSNEERQSLPDDCFALVLLNGEQKLRKFACVDQGNTTLSVQYFLKNAHKLPEEAKQIAAENLKTACAWYSVPVPEELEKMAGLAAKAWTAATAIPIAVGTKDEIKGRMGAVRALEGRGDILTPAEMHGASFPKQGELSGTATMPYQNPTSSVPSKTVIKKTAAMHPYVDVENKEPRKVMSEKKASQYALRGKYPLDNYAQVKTATEYFDQYGRRFSPTDRHDYCVALVKRASELAIPVSEIIEHYGATDFGPEDQIKMAFDARRLELQDKDHLELLRGIQEQVQSFMGGEKIASFTGPSQDLACGMLQEFDKVTGLEHHYDRTIPDPFYSIYGVEKVAEWSEVMGNDIVTETSLRRLARAGRNLLSQQFGDSFVDEFTKDPVGIFKSLPRDQKKILMRMAGENLSVGIGLSA